MIKLKTCGRATVDTTPTKNDAKKAHPFPLKGVPVIMTLALLFLVCSGPLATVIADLFSFVIAIFGPIAFHTLWIIAAFGLALVAPILPAALAFLWRDDTTHG